MADFNTDPFAAGGDAIELAQTRIGGEAIGQVSAAEGQVTITHTDGSKVAASAGTPIFQGDLIETKDAGAVGITFADNSTFSLADNGSMVIDEMIYDPNSQTGKSAISVAQGVFTFISGQIAKTDVDAMTIKTPVAVIGIRGTAGGGKAGPEGTPNTFSMFIDPKAGPGGGVGEMTIKSLGGGEVVLNKPLQTTQVVSQFVPPIKPIVLPPGVATQFYAKATILAPTKPEIAPSAPAAGPTGALGGPTGDSAPPDGLADKATDEAFQQALAAGGSLDAAIGAAVNMAAGVQLQGALALNPNAFGSLQSGDAIMNAIVDRVFVGVTGQYDLLSAGTGKGAGFNEVVGTFFQSELGAVLTGGLANVGFGGYFGPGGGLFGPAFGPGFGPGFGDPFGINPFAFGFAPPPGFTTIFEKVFIGIATDVFLSQGTIAVFDEFLNGTTGNDVLVGTGLNTQITMIQGVSLGGTDTVNGGGGQDELKLSNLSNIDLVYEQTSVVSGVIFGTITYSGAGGTVTGSISLSSIEQIFADDGTESFQRLAFDTSDVGLFGYIRAGTSGDDTLSLAQTTDLQGTLGSGDPVGAANTIMGGIIFGGAGNDVLTGSADSDIIFGGAGNDTLNGGGAGIDTHGDAIFGGAGDDIFVIDAPASILIGGNPFGSYQAGDAGEVTGDTLRLVAGGGTYVLASPGGLFALTGFEVLDIADTTTANTIVQAQSTFFSNLDSIITGAGGNDTLRSSDPSLILDTVGSVSAGIAFLEATNAGSGVFISDANDAVGRTITGSSNPDNLNGRGGNDIIIGHAGPDILTGGSGSDSFGWISSEIAAAGTNFAAYDRITDFTSGSTSGDIFVWEEALTNQVTPVTVPADSTFLAANFADNATVTGTVITTDPSRVIFEFTNTLGIDIILGVTTSAAIESAAAAVLAGVAHNIGDNLLFAMYDNATTTSTVTLLKFTGDATTTGITASELQVVAVADVAVNSLTVDNFDVNTLPG